MFSFIARRGIHTVPKLPNLQQLKNNGIPNILSAQGFKQCWLDQQEYYCNKLTLNTAGTTLESYLPFHILLNTAKRPYQSHIFNIASGAHNNHLFMENILPASEKQSPSPALMERIKEQYGEWEDLKAQMIERAEEDVIGQGWLFLVENGEKEIHILTVNNNGTPYYFPRNQSFDMNVTLSEKEFEQWKAADYLTKTTDIEDWTIPLIAVNLWDYAYLKDYGVAGRSEYVKNVLDNLNWTAVNSRLYLTTNNTSS
ncbi:HDL310Cp [Eremothecium sinecaudum]|uniref:HDL310Cp n=1 Tax=Eremothecium sinecaudum TaxID=45286 RepID=A0A0X8HS39_9SACH|nr:HDL310Cp [Eremothecium sinecaudum]AMD20434.1 HDL310Cp [Eremothecium sinecaudum]